MLENYIVQCSKMSYGLTYIDIRKLALAYAKSIGCNYPKNWDKSDLAGVDWLQGYMKRHAQFSLRKPENTSLARATSFNKTNVSEFQGNYQRAYSRTYPERWKTSEIIMLPKPGKSRKDSNSYRPISLVSAISKICEKIIYRIINDHLNSNAAIPNKQYGFRKLHNASHQVCRITEPILKNFTISTKTGVIFLNVAKAFD